MMLILFILYLKILVKLLFYLKKKILNINVFSVRYLDLQLKLIESLFHKFIIDFLPNYIYIYIYILPSILYFILKIVYIV